jgi:hypothetical protein
MIHRAVFIASILTYDFDFLSQRPVVAAGCFIAPNASVVGDVLLFNDVSVRKTLPLLRIKHGV